jgi:hypothetical protein
MKRNVRAQTGVNYEVRTKINHERLRVEVLRVSFFVSAGVCLHASFCAGFKCDVFAVPTAAQRHIVVADHAEKRSSDMNRSST